MTKDKALRMAIEALEDALTKFSTFNEMQHEAIQACKEALEKPTTEQSSLVQEPVAWRWIGLHGYAFGVKNPFAKDSIEHQHKYEVTPLYTTPPSREWVGLSDEEIEEGFKEGWVTKQAFESSVWWAEAKLKEKNNGT